MKKLLFCFLLFTEVLIAQSQQIDSTQYDYVGYAIDSTIYSGNVTYLNEIFDTEYILRKVTIKSEDKYVKDFNIGFEKGLKESFNYAQKIIKEVGDNGSFDFIRSHVNNKGDYHLLFRMYGDDGLNYHNYLLKKINGEIKVVDVYYFISGEYISKTLSDIYNASLSNRPNLFTKFFKKTIADDLIKVKTIRALISEGKYKEAYKNYKTISSEGKKQKAFQLIGIQITSEIDDETYQNFIRNYEKSFPNDPSLYLVSIDGAFLNGNYDKVLDLIERLNTAIGGDDFLDFFRLNVFYQKGDKLTALKYARRMVENFPHHIDSHSTLLTVLIELKQNNEALKTLENFYSIFELTKESMKEAMESDYPDFVKTEEYKNWFKQE